jgi:hypothetical protein
VDLSDLQVWHYGLIIGGAILVLGLVLYFLGVRKIKVPPVVPAGFAGLAVGFAAGVIWLAGFGYKPLGDGDDPANAAAPKGDAVPKGGGGGKGGAGKGGGMPKGGLGGAPPSPRNQLVTLINALDVLVDRPVAVTLTAEDRAAIAAQLRGLDAAGEIKEDEAKAKLDAILKVVEKNRNALEAVGYRWPSPGGKGGLGPKGGPPAPEGTNPFQVPETAAKVKSLQDRLAK